MRTHRAFNFAASHYIGNSTVANDLIGDCQLGTSFDLAAATSKFMTLAIRKHAARDPFEVVVKRKAYTDNESVRAKKFAQSSSSRQRESHHEKAPKNLCP